MIIFVYRAIKAMTMKWFVALLMMWITPAFAQMDAGMWTKGIWTKEMRGTVGSNRIGVALTIQDNRTLIAAHYFYAKYLINIPLTGSIQGKEFELNAPGGGSFHLHFIGDGSAAGQTLTFFNSIGLEGVWIGNGQTLPVKIHPDYEFFGSGSADFYGGIDSTVYEARVRKCIRSVIKGDKNAAAELVSYPLRVNGSPSFSLKTKTELLARWDRIFTPSVMKALRDAVPHEMFMRNDQAMIGNGDVWFNETGYITVINQTDALEKHRHRAAFEASK